MLCNVKEIFKVKKRNSLKGTKWVIELGKTDFCLFGLKYNKAGFLYAPDTRSLAQRSE